MILAVDGTADLTIDEPLDLIGGPVDLVGVVVVEGVGELGNVARVVVCESRRQHRFDCNHHDAPSLGREIKLTVRDALEVPVGLRSAQINTNKLIINLVLDVGQQDESSHHTPATARLELGLDIAIPHVLGRRQHSSDAVLGHGQQHVAVKVSGLSLGHPVGRGRVAEVIANVGDAAEVLVKGHRLGLAHGRGRARVERKGHSGIAAAEAVGANTTLAIF